MSDEQTKTELTEEDLTRIGAAWIDRIHEAGKREERWIKAAEAAEAAYLCDAEESEDGDVPDFNILHSNVETIVPAVYNSTPAPDIRPRHNARDEQAKQFADALERAISTQIDDDKLDVEIEALAQDVEVAGRGITRIKFDVADDGVNGARVIYENVSWRDYREGPSKRWNGVPWVSYRHCISQDDAEGLEDAEINEVRAKAKNSAEGYERDEEQDVDVWEIWCKETRQVYFVVEHSSRVLSVKDDPLGLAGFFPQPDTVVPIKGTGRRKPVCPFSVYKALATELDIATRRINAIMKGLKVRGLFAGDGEIAQAVADLDDYELHTSKDLKSLASTGGLANAVMWWPVDLALAVLAQLYQEREQTKAAIYEVTGISDIVRGASDANETAAAQKIKTQWGSIRIKRKQRMIQSHVRDLFKLTAEVIATKFTPQGLAQAAGLPADEQVLSGLAQMMGKLDHYRIDVESDSTVRADLDKQRGEMAQFLEATGGFFGTMGPLVADKPEMAPAALEIFNAFARSFQLGKQAEDAIDQMGELARQSAGQQKPNPAEEAQKAELQLKQGDQQLKAQEIQIKGMQAQVAMMKAQSDAQLNQQRAAFEAQKLQLEQLKLRMEAAKAAQAHGLQVRQQDIAEMQAEIDALLRVEEMKMEADQRRPVEFG